MIMGRTNPKTMNILITGAAGNSVMVNRKRYPDRHAVGLYNRVRCRRGHATAIGAVARHLAESTYWILTKKEPYLERGIKVFADESMRACVS